MSHLSLISPQTTPPTASKSSICTLNQNNRIQTFDGRGFGLTGKCNYVFVRDCSPSSNPAKRSFSIHIVQKYRPDRNLLLRIRLKETTIYLSHLGRVRINNELVKLPYIMFGQFSIVSKNHEIRLKAIAGIEIRFTVNRTVEVKLKQNFHNKVCGLCGNFNNDPNDDFRAKKSQNIVDLQRFLHSYKVGKTPFCPRGQSFSTRRTSKNVIKTRKLQDFKAKIQLQSRRLTFSEFRRRYPIGMI